MPIYNENKNIIASEIHVDLSTTSKLDFAQIKETAQAISDRNQSISWLLNLGLFEQLRQPLEDQTQFLSLKYGLDQFIDFLMDNEQWHTESIIFCELTPPFYKDLVNLPNFMPTFTQVKNINIEQSDLDSLIQDKSIEQELIVYSLEVISDFISNLTAYISDDLAPSVCIDMTSLSVKDQLLIGFGSLFDTTRIYAKNPSFLSHHHSWECPISFQSILSLESTYTLKEKPLAALFISDINRNPEAVEIYASAIDKLQSNNISFFAVRSDQLTLCWEQVDTLFILPSSLDTFDKRAVHGFEAAEGSIVSLDNTLSNDISSLITWDQWTKNT